MVDSAVVVVDAVVGGVGPTLLALQVILTLTFIGGGDRGGRGGGRG